MPDFSPIPESKKSTTTANNGSFFKPSAVPVPAIQKEDAKPEDKKPDEKKEDVSVGFADAASLKKLVSDLFGKFPEHWQNAFKTYDKTHSTYVLDLTEARKLLSNEITALWNVSNAIAYLQYTKYKNADFFDAIKVSEAVSGTTDTYLNLASLVFQKDMKKYVSDEVPDIVKKNLGIVLITGLLAQGGFTAIKYATSGEADFTKLLSPILSSYTDAPTGFTNPLQPDNKVDPRFNSPFGKPSTDLNVSTTKDATDPAKPKQFNVNLGLNIASLLDLYPKDDEAKKKYKGLEAEPFFNFTRAYGQGGAESKDKYFAGIFIGDKGFYTLMEYGVIKGDLGDVETYGKAGFVLKNLGNLRLLSTDAELDQRPGNTALRARINSAAQIDIVNNRDWQLTLGASVGGLVPGGLGGGALDYGGSLQFYRKDYLKDDKTPYKTGVDISASSRQQDPFDESSQRLLTVRTGVVFGGVLKLNLQYDQVSGTGGVNVFGGVPPSVVLPDKNLTVNAAIDLAPLIFGSGKK